MKNVFYFVAVLVVGALIGSFLGEFLAISLPSDSSVHRLFAQNISAGLKPTTLDLRIIEVTIGLLLHFNITSLIGMLVAAIAFKALTK